MLVRLFLLFTVVPVVELALLIWIGSHLGILTTVAVVILTGLLGAALARREGIRAWTEVQRTMSEGRLPAVELVEAVLVLIAGVVLVTPGVLTDALGFALLIPQSRRVARQWLQRRFETWLAQQPAHVVTIDGAAVEVRRPEPAGAEPEAASLDPAP